MTPRHALVLTGSVLPGFDAERTWPELAARLRIDPVRLRDYSNNNTITGNSGSNTLAGGGGTDTLSNFENVIGSKLADLLTGDGGANRGG